MFGNTKVWFAGGTFSTASCSLCSGVYCVWKHFKVWFAGGTFSKASCSLCSGVYCVWKHFRGQGADSNLEIVLDPDIDSGIQPAYNPTHLIVDFEAAAIKAFLEMYPAL